MPMYAYLKQYRRGERTGIFYIDFAMLPVCHNMRIPNNKVFMGVPNEVVAPRDGFMGVQVASCY